MDTFGSPERGDITSRMEKDIIAAVNDATDRADRDVPTVINRPPGIQKTSSEDQTFDYQNRGPDYWPKLWEGLVQGHGPTGAALQLIRHSLEQEKQLRGG